MNWSPNWRPIWKPRGARSARPSLPAQPRWLCVRARGRVRPGRSDAAAGAGQGGRTARPPDREAGQCGGSKPPGGGADPARADLRQARPVPGDAPRRGGHCARSAISRRCRTRCRRFRRRRRSAPSRPRSESRSQNSTPHLDRRLPPRRSLRCIAPRSTLWPDAERWPSRSCARTWSGGSRLISTPSSSSRATPKRCRRKRDGCG